MRAYRAFLLVLLTLGIAYSSPTRAQDGLTCVRFTTDAVQDVGNNCANVPVGTACYGYGGIEISTFGSSAQSEFTQPTDRIELASVQQLATTNLSENSADFGIATLNLQANLPRAFPGKGVVMMTLGEVYLENQVAPDEALILPDEPVAVTAGSNGSTLYSEPSSPVDAALMLGEVAAGTQLQADGVSPDGDWLRVFVLAEKDYAQSSVAWVRLEELVAPVNRRGLPTITADSLTPMQSFNFSMGESQSICGDQPTSLLYIQGPEHIESRLIINGADIHFGSTLLIRLLPPGNILQVIVIDGIALLNANTPDQLVIPPGFFSQVCLSEPDEDGLRTVGSDCAWSEPQILAGDVLESLFTLLDDGIPQNLQYYGTYVPRLICPSGIGQPRCTIELRYEPHIAYVDELCEAGLLSDEVCELYES